MSGRSLYRIMSLEHFEQMCQYNKLYFVKPKAWEDKYEGYLFQIINKYGLDHFLEFTKRHRNEFQDPEFNKLFASVFRAFEKMYFAQSWTLCPESDAMWKSYNHNNKSIRIEINESDVQKLNLFREKEIDRIKSIDILYENDLSLIKELRRCGLGQNKTLTDSAFTVKRKDLYEHEKEVRLIKKVTSIVNEVNESDLERLTAQFFLATGEIPDLTTTRHPDHLWVDYSHVHNFIKSAYLHPKSSPIDEAKASELCAKNNIVYLGRSRMLDPI